MDSSSKLRFSVWNQDDNNTNETIANPAGLTLQVNSTSGDYAYWSIVSNSQGGSAIHSVAWEVDLESRLLRLLFALRGHDGGV